MFFSLDCREVIPAAAARDDKPFAWLPFADVEVGGCDWDWDSEVEFAGG